MAKNGPKYLVKTQVIIRHVLECIIIELIKHSVISCWHLWDSKYRLLAIVPTSVSAKLTR